MTTYPPDIRQWAADTAHHTHDLHQASLALRRSSFSGSTASESSALSSDSQQSSATSFSNGSFTTFEQEVNFDLDAGNDCTNGKDVAQQWYTLSNLVDGQVFSEAESKLNNVSLSVATSYSDRVERATQNARPSIVLTENNLSSSIAPVLPKLETARDYRAALRESRPINHRAHCEAWLAARKQASTEDNTSQRVSISQNFVARRSCASDFRIHGSQHIIHNSTGTNPRRTSTSRSWSKPPLIRQQERRDDFVLNLVECATQLVAYLWPKSTNCPMVPLNFFIQETLRRSRSTYSTLQLTLYYLYLLRGKERQLTPYSTGVQRTSAPAPRGMDCGRRMFLAALILASKYLQDRNFSTNAWTKITNLPAQEINTNEKMFLTAIGYSMHLPLEKYNDWCSRVRGCVEYVTLGLPCPWSEVLQEYNDTQLYLDKTLPSDPTRHTTFGSAQLSSSPVIADSTNVDGSSIRLRKNTLFTLHDVEDEKSSIPPSSLRSREAIPPAPQVASLDQKFTAPDSTTSFSDDNASAACVNARFDGTSVRRIDLSYATVEASRQTDGSSLEFVSMQQLSRTGSHKAPELAGNAASSATSQFRHGDMCANLAEFTSSPLSLTGSDGTSLQKSRPRVRRTTTGLSISTLLPTACHVPSPLRLSMTSQLPTPPMSARSIASAGTEMSDSAISYNDKSEVITTSKAVNAPMNLAHRVALEAQKHGLETVALPPMQFQTLHESFSDCSSDAQLDTPESGYAEGIDYSTKAFQAQVQVLRTMESLRHQPASLPAIEYLLRCGLREHLKPVMQSSQSGCVPDIQAARTLSTLKRSFSDIDATPELSVKTRRTVSCRRP